MYDFILFLHIVRHTSNSQTQVQLENVVLPKVIIKNNH